MNPAFAYVYDEFLADRRFEREVSMIEAELANRGISGRVARLAMFRNARQMVEDLVRGGAKNVVFVGNDETLLKMMWFLPDLPLTVGYLPVIAPQRVAGLLGIPLGVPAVDVLAARLVETLDVGRIGDRYFLTEAVVPATVAAVEIEGKFRLRPSEGGAIAVRNLGSPHPDGHASADPKDGWLEAVVQARPESADKPRLFAKGEIHETHLKFRHGSIISSEPIDVFVDGHVLNGFQFPLAVIPAKLKVITGRERKLAAPPPAVLPS